MYNLVGRTEKYAYLFPPALQNNQDGVGHNFKIHGKRHVFDIQNVVFQALDHLINIGGITKFYLSPRRNAGFNLLQKAVMRRLLHDLINIILPFRTRAYQRHITNKNRIKLWCFIQS